MGYVLYRTLVFTNIILLLGSLLTRKATFQTGMAFSHSYNSIQNDIQQINISPFTSLV